MASFGIKAFDFGAKGDGITDDTAPPFRLQLILPQSVASATPQFTQNEYT